MLSDAQVAALRAEARRRGISEDDLIKAAESMAAKSAKPESQPSDVKLFQYHLPFIKVSELRSFIGITDAIDGDEMLCGEFLEKFGGALNPNGDAGTPSGSGV